MLALTASLPMPILINLGTMTLQLQTWLARLLASPAVIKSAKSSYRLVDLGRTLSEEKERKEEVEVETE